MWWLRCSCWQSKFISVVSVNTFFQRFCKRLLNTTLHGRVALQGSTYTHMLLLEDAEVCFGSSHDVVWFHMWWGEGEGDSFHSRDAYLTFPVNHNHVNITAHTHTHTRISYIYNQIWKQIAVLNFPSTLKWACSPSCTWTCMWTDVYGFHNYR